MPIVTVRALPPAAPETVPACLDAVVLSLAAALEIPPRDVWAHWVEATAMHIGDEPRQFHGHCPVLTVRARTGRSDAEIARGLEAVAEAAARSLALPVEDIWVHWEELPPGRVYAGGGLR